MANTVELFANSAQSTLAGAISNIATALSVASGAGALFPSPNNAQGQFFRLSLTDATTGLLHEIVYVTARSADTFTITRAQEGTTAQAWQAGDICANMNTAGAMGNLVQQAQAQSGNLTYSATDTGTANSYAITLTPALPVANDAVRVRFKAAHANTGASTLTVNGGTSYPLVGLGGAALQGGEITANGICECVFNNSLGTAPGSYVLQSCTSAALAVGAATQSGHAVQLGQAQQFGHGQCRLSVASATQLKLSPFNGQNVIVNGVPLQIPLAGITLSNSGLLANTLYYIYLGGNTAAPVLSAVTTGHSTGTNGVEIQTGNAAVTLVGMAYTNASSQFVDSATSRTVLNWFNRRALPASIVTSGSINYTATSNTEISAAVRLVFLTWGDEGVPVNLMGQYTNNTAGASVSIQSYVDGAAYGAVSASYIPTASTGTTYASGNSMTALGAQLAEGVHTAGVYGSVTSGTGTSAQMSHSLIVRG